MPSFDVVSKVDLMELDNGLNTARKELGQRYDFRGTNTDIERGPEGIEARIPELAILRHPGVELPERFGPERVEPPLPVRTDRDESRFLQDAQVARHPGLVDVHPRHDVVDGAFAGPKGLDDLKAVGVGQGLKGE